MSVGDSRMQVSELILEEACQWFIDFNEGELDLAGHEAFNSWLRRSPEHVRAYLEIATAWRESPKVKGQGSESGAVVATAENNTVLLANSDSAPRTRRRAIVDRLPLAIAASALLAVGIALLSQRNTHVTHVGEQTSFVLEDGSAVELDALSDLRVHFSQAQRSVELIEGQALFRVKKDSARPFIVVANNVSVRAIGTQFDVYRKATGTTVTVIEGRVAVTAAVFERSGGSLAATGHAWTGSPIFLSAGEQVTVSPSITPQVAQADVGAATAWTQLKLVFDETPLSEVALEFNRYNNRKLIIKDASLAQYHIRGSFEATDPDRLIHFLRERFGTEVRVHGNETYISRH
jgi:transmembrane sensor